MKNYMFRKGLVFSVIVLFFGASTVPLIGGTNVEKHNSIDDRVSFMGFNSRGDILYVGGSGPSNYSKIQDAINDSSSGDTVFVYDDSSPYYENVVVDKSINLIGEDKALTVIDGDGNYDVVYISVDSVNISGFTIQNSGNSGRDAGIELNSNYTTIINNIILNNNVGVFIYHSNDNTVSENIIISNNDYGAYLHSSDSNFISQNTFSNNRWGIYFIYSIGNSILDNNVDSNNHYGIWISRFSNNNTISGNIINLNNDYGLFFYKSNSNNISSNVISNSSEGIYLFYSNSNAISRNNFLNNKEDASFRGADNKWKRNYWNRSRLLPKLIVGQTSSVIPSFDCDWRPAQEPYDIPYPSLVTSIDILPTISKNECKNQAIVLPPYFSWRDINGTDFTTPIKNQSPSPTCEAYALCVSLETLVQYEVGYPFGCDLSETHLYFYAGGTCEAGGVLLGDAAEYLIEYGVPDEGCFPDPHRPYDYPFESLPGWQNRTVKIQEWGWVENDVEAMKHALIVHGPLVIHIMVRPDFVYYKDGIYTPQWGKITGGHLIAIIGYDDEQQCWIVKNSAGENWGEEGYVRVAYTAHNPMHPFIWPFYGGTGILYVDGVYGNLMPDVPKIYIEQPKRQHTYLFGHEFPTLFKKVSFVQKGAPRVIGAITIKVNATNTNKVEFYLDGEFQCVDEEPPYKWELCTSSGLHIIETLAYNENNISKDITDVFVFNRN